jgi:hypothetical protein
MQNSRILTRDVSQKSIRDKSRDRFEEFPHPELVVSVHISTLLLISLLHLNLHDPNPNPQGEWSFHGHGPGWIG